MNALTRIAFTLSLVLGTAVLASEGAAYSDPDLYPVVSGKVTELRISTKSDFALDWSIPKYGEEPVLEADEVFVEVLFLIKKGYSIGKFDYKLSGFDCLAVAEGTNPYNPETREIVAKEGERSVRLLFKGKKADKQKGFNLVFQYSTKDALADSLPEELKSLQLDFISGASAAAPADDEPKGGDGEEGKKEEAKKRPKVDGRW